MTSKEGDLNWHDAIGFLPTLFKIEIGIFYYKLAGESAWHAYFVGLILCGLHLFLVYGFFDAIVRIFNRPYKYFRTRWLWLSKLEKILTVQNSNLNHNARKIRRWLIRRQYLWFFILYSLPFVPILSSAVIATVKVTRASSKKGFLSMLSAVPVKVGITVIIIYYFPSFGNALIEAFRPILNLLK